MLGNNGFSISMYENYLNAWKITVSVYEYLKIT